jgi:hypothetical protein
MGRQGRPRPSRGDERAYGALGGSLVGRGWSSIDIPKTATARSHACFQAWRLSRARSSSPSMAARFSSSWISRSLKARDGAARLPTAERSVQAPRHSHERAAGGGGVLLVGGRHAGVDSTLRHRPAARGAGFLPVPTLVRAGSLLSSPRSAGARGTPPDIQELAIPSRPGERVLSVRYVR